MIRNHHKHIHHTIDDRSLPIRVGITLATVVSLPLFARGVRTLAARLELGRLVIPLLVLAHAPAVIAVLAVWSIGCDVCRPAEST